MLNTSVSVGFTFPIYPNFARNSAGNGGSEILQEIMEGKFCDKFGVEMLQQMQEMVVF